MRIGADYLGEGRCKFTVWAPQVEAAAVQIVAPDERLIPMVEEPGGYWRATAEGIEPGTLYFYQLNGDESRPDPAAQFQPEGVHGPSQVVDHGFDWHDQDWVGIPLEDLILYELHVGTFTPEGTFAAIIDRLKDLKALGVNAIELMPIAQFPGNETAEGGCAYRNWGYDGVYPFAVQNSYGGPEGLKQLVDACHQQGLSVFLDVVYNHFGPEGNYTSRFGPYFTDTYRTPWGSAINFDDAHSPGVRNFFIENALYWLREYHLDGLRLDAIHAIYDLGAKHFLAELAERVAAFSQEQGRQQCLIAESDLNDPCVIRPLELGGHGMDGQWSDDFHHALYTLLTGEQIGYYQDFGACEHLAKAYQDSFVYDWRYSAHRQRFHGNCARDRDPAQFVVCIQNHDQVGNRPFGERLSQLVPFEALKLAAGAVLLSPYTPLLFMGEEYGEEAPFTYFVSHADPDLIAAVRQGRKLEFAEFHAEGEALDPEALDTFLMCKLNWQQHQSGKHQTLWSFYQHLIRLRQTLPALRQRHRQAMATCSDEAQKLVGWRRWSEHQELYCWMNFNSEDVIVKPELLGRSWRKLLESADSQWLGPGSLLPETLAPAQPLTLRSQSLVLYEAVAP